MAGAGDVFSPLKFLFLRAEVRGRKPLGEGRLLVPAGFGKLPLEFDGSCG